MAQSTTQHFARRESRVGVGTTPCCGSFICAPGLYGALYARMNLIRELLGLGAQPDRLTTLQVILRGVIVFMAAVLVCYIGGKSLNRKTVCDLLVLAGVGWILSCAINGSGSFFTLIGAAFALALFYRSAAALRIRRSSRARKGS